MRVRSHARGPIVDNTSTVKVHLVDGTYELFRHFFAVPRQQDAGGVEIAAARGVTVSILGMLEGGASHVAVATDHVVESFRNRLWPGYKDGSGIDPDLRFQFDLVEEALTALGVVVWPMVEYEADDALGAGAAMAASDPRVEQVVICTPDKDIAQAVVGRRVVQLDRRRRILWDEVGVVERLGVLPKSVPDYLALTGDSADGFPGLRGWGPRSASAVLSRFGHLEQIPARAADWGGAVRGAERLAATLVAERDRALLFRHIATLSAEAPVNRTVDELAWRGARPEFAAMATRLQAPDLVRRVAVLDEARARG